MSESENIMVNPRITKVTVNIGVGEGGQRLQLAEQVLEILTGMKPSRTLSKKTNRDLGTRKGAPIGCKVTMRGDDRIEAFLKDAFWVREHTLPEYSFDDIGIFGMDINVVLERPGHRVSRRRRRKSRVPRSHMVGRVESKTWFVERFGLNIVEE